MNTTAELQLNQQVRRRRSPVNSSRLIVYTSILVMMSLLFYSESQQLPGRFFYRYVSLVPVLYIAYRYGLREGFLAAFFFSSAFIPQLIQEARVNWASTATIHILAYSVLLHAGAYIIADIATSTRTHEALSSAVREWSALLARTTALDEVIAFLLSQAGDIVPTEATIFLLRNPLDAQWQITTTEGTLPLPASSNVKDGRISLAEWLLLQEETIYVNHLNRRASFIYPSVEAKEELRSILSYPLRQRDGTLIGMLVLLNKEVGDFTKFDADLLKDLINGGEKALEQAGLYARTDYALARRVRQLAAIQRTARDLNATLDPHQIIERTLECALEITDAQGGVISLDMKGFPPMYESQGVQIDSPQQSHLVARANEFERATILTSPEGGAPPLLPSFRSRLIAPVKRGGQTMGVIIVGSSSPSIFKEASRHVLTILADHAAIALENARLFQEIQMEQQRVSLIITTITEGLFTTNLDGQVITFNPAAEMLTGWSAEDSCGRNFCEVLGCHPDEQQGECSLEKAIREKRGIQEDRFMILNKMGRNRVISLNMTPMPATKGHPEGFVFLFRDVTEKDEMERVQNELIAAISHELRAPLANISTITEMLLSKSEETGVRPYARYFVNLMTQTQRLADFANRILEVYRMETGKMNLQLRPVPICLLVDKLIYSWQVTSTQHTIAAELPEKSPWIWTDEKAFESILSNLLDNAVKYSPPGTTITVIVEQPEAGYVVCGVRDQGPGIAADLQGKVFSRFYRVDGGDSQTVYGHGLGLYIAKNLVENMRGKIWVESEEGQGSYFAFSMPLMEESNEGEDFSH